MPPAESCTPKSEMPENALATAATTGKLHIVIGLPAVLPPDPYYFAAARAWADGEFLSIARERIDIALSSVAVSIGRDAVASIAGRIVSGSKEPGASTSCERRSPQPRTLLKKYESKLRAWRLCLTAH